MAKKAPEKDELIESQRRMRDSRFYKEGGNNDLTIICPDSKAGPRRSFRLSFTMEQIARIERGMRGLGFALTPVEYARFGRADVTFLALVVAAGMANRANQEAKEELLNEDEVLAFLTTRPGLQKYWQPIVNVALCDVYERDLFAPEVEEDERIAGDDMRGEGTSAEA